MWRDSSNQYFIGGATGHHFKYTQDLLFFGRCKWAGHSSAEAHDLGKPWARQRESHHTAHSGGESVKQLTGERLWGRGARNNKNSTWKYIQGNVNTISVFKKCPRYWLPILIMITCAVIIKSQYIAKTEINMYKQGHLPAKLQHITSQNCISSSGKQNSRPVYIIFTQPTTPDSELVGQHSVWDW